MMPTQSELVVLKFLQIETFTSVKVIQQLMEHRTIQASYQLLNRMIGKGLINSHKFEVLLSRPITLFGITTIGLGVVLDPSERFVSRPTFQQSKVSISTLQHKLDLQYLHLIAKKQGAEKWVDGSQFGGRKNERKVPDAVVTFDNFLFAVEVERHIKSIRRLRDIIKNHLLAIKRGEYCHVIYASPNQELAEKLLYIWRSIEYVNLNGSRILINDKHIEKFSFLSYSKFNLIGVKNVLN